VHQVRARLTVEQVPDPAVRGVSAVVPLEDVDAGPVVLDAVDGGLVRAPGTADDGPQTEAVVQRPWEHAGVAAQVPATVPGACVPGRVVSGARQLVLGDGGP